MIEVTTRSCALRQVKEQYNGSTSVGTATEELRNRRIRDDCVRRIRLIG